MIQQIRHGRLAACLVALCTTVGAQAALADVNVYSYRQDFLIRPLMDAFTKETGIPVNIIFASQGLEERMKQEGANSPADLLLTSDVGRLAAAVEEGLAQPVTSPVLTANIPAALRDPGGLWYALTTRARVLYVSRDRVPEGAIATYEDLAKPEWKGRVCTRSGNHDYNIGLIAAMISNHGEAATEQWLRGVKANLARKPQGNDRAQVKAIWQGECDVAIGNSYYMGNMLADPEQAEWANAVRILFPNQNGSGTHMNVSGMIMAAHAPNRADALKLMEFLTGKQAQAIYAEQNFEYPANPDVPWSALLQGWGTFRMDPLDMTRISANRAAAARMVDRVGFND